ncbi:DNA repair protein RecN [Muribaculum intestinale]|jgi:DNA repair protein RecN (Recombination protein N)|uniref:DNA repair protein RecN n=1 Tax=Muribaculum intestinale TaxID=1796646 RepID=UPI000F46CCF7|nr:DNA repair protein RecN [Muribaculum intestinale]ROT05772.1 DNA repair protein RecN [Muribaculaceae bacterium Isolate-100 (HZI)]RXE64834.1 DNA repair protein RecN [Muribaculaceae bacterium Isolate-007 (NCI)]
MLRSLHISNYALIDTVDITFHNGLNIITGETGAGKSIMLGALSLILGERADLKAVRDSGRKSVIEATFELHDYKRLKEYCVANDIEWDDNVCILRREIAPAGRSRAFINDSPVTLDLLSHVAMLLVDIHSQHNNRLLASPEFQLSIIDTLAGNEQLLADYSRRFVAYRRALKRLRDTKKLIEQNRQDEDFTRFQLEQLDAMNLEAGEQEQLEKDRDVLANITEIKSTLGGALDSLSNGTSNAIALLGDAMEYCEQLSQVLDDADNIVERLNTAHIELRDIADTLSDFDRDLNADPDELEAVEQRLNDIYSLQSKHHVSSVEALIELRENFRIKLSSLENSSYTIEELEKEARRSKAAAKEIAAELTRRRTEEARRFEKLLCDTASPLGMKNLRAQVEITTGDMSSTGMDTVEFKFAFNKNQPLMPVGSTASGGEISRLMLSVKSIIASRMQLPSIIFDEIDTGVSGDVANRMGLMMRDISRSIQVMAITHLPQVAALGNAHYKVYKIDDEDATHTHIHQLDREQRIDEIAVMLSGSTVDAAARANALSLLSASNN